MKPAPHEWSTANDWLPWWAERQGSKIAFRMLDEQGDEQEVLTYAGLHESATHIAGFLAGGRGERALLVYASGLDFVRAFFGCLYAGVLPVPVVPPRRGKLRQSTVTILESARPRYVFAPDAELDGLPAQLPAHASIAWTSVARARGASRPASPLSARPEDLAFLQYTSGSTSAPRGVMVSHANLRSNFDILRTSTGADTDSVYASWLPLFHDMGLVWNVLEPVFLGASTVLLAPLTFVHRPLAWLRAISRYRAEISGAPNFAFDMLVARYREAEVEDLDLASWRFCYNAAEPVRAETMDAFLQTYRRHGLKPSALKACYGMAEATLMIAGGPPGPPAVITTASRAGLLRHELAKPEDERDTVRIVASGRIGDAQRVEIVDPDTRERRPPGGIGEIWVSGANIASGYYENAEASERVFGGRLADTGEGPFLRTGDLGIVHEGQIYITGRSKDVIIVRGQNHYPQDIERTAERAHPALRRAFSTAFLVGDEHDPRLVLVMEVERTATPELNVDSVIGDIRAAVVAEHDLLVSDVALIRYGTLGKTSSGKVQRTSMRTHYLEGTLERWTPTEGGPR